ncbi:Uncharacterised protein [Mycoplasmopsis maculosa]|uniref:PDxFFG protein n=1 Tax=Mycoplasmopsis maculosa TaxID=114885 RepID=A0A449B500_9BACT|nr:hypothetical protein [Mycoplasmopsis maculosa]VEU75646.1 Uncharacterised protein [Mycoplasmopsis maculosa]
MIDQASQAIQTRLGFLQRLRVFYLYFQEKSNQYQTLLDEVNRGEKPATDFHVLLFRISGELAEFLNNTQSNPFPPFVGRIVSQIKNLIDTNNQTITTKYRLSVHTLYETYNSIQTNYGDALRLEQVAQIELESLKAQKTSFEKIQTNSELQNQLQKVKENVSILESFSEKQNEYNNLFNHLYPAELDNSLAILSDAEKKMKELEETISTFLNNDLVVKKARENLDSLKDTKSKLNKSLDEIKEIDKSSGFEEAFNELNQKLEEFEKVVDNFSNDYKYSLFYVTLRVQGLLGENSSSIDRRNAINDILKQTNFSNDEKNVLVTTVEYFDNIKRPKNIRDQISTIHDSVLLIVDKLANAYKQTAPLKSKFIDELKEDFNNKVLSVFAQLNEADKNNASISEQIKNINNAITNFDKELAKEHIQSELLDVYKSRLNNISQELALIVSEDARGGYINSLLALLVHDAWERYNKEEEKLTRILLPVVTFESINDKGKLISEVNKKISEIDAEIESERLFLNLDPSKRDEKEAKIADLEAQKSKEQEKIKSLEKITEIIKGLERYTGEYVKYDRNTFTSTNDIRSLFNATVDTFITRENNINTSLNRAKEKLSEFREYFNINISSYDLDKRLLNIYNKAVDDSSNLLINSRINEINRQTLENALLTEKGFDLLNSEEIHISKSRIKLIDELTKKGILKANATDEEINNLIYKVNLTNITKDNSVLTLTFRERSKTSNAAYSPDYITPSLRGYSNKFIKVNIDANISDKRVSAINEIFSELGYKKLVSPTLIKESGNILNSETGLSEKGYDVFADAYENLTSNLLEEVPYAGEWLNGEHIVKKLDENGEFVYSIENGPYLGFSKDSRVGLWAILKMSDPNFKGISTDFLKFVGAHEYGHHMTLNGAQDLGNKGNKPIFISALTPNGTPNINNYYSRDVVELYLDARTHVKMGAKRLLDQFGVLRDYGEYPEFYFAKKENDSISYEDKVETLVKSLESEKDIWGVDLNDQSLREALKNKKRRFLQNFSGLLEAVKARREANGLVAKDDEKWLQPFDLWILNAVDNFSATLNPSMSGTAKYMVKENGKYVYKDASIRMLDGVLKDGAGNKVVFEEQVQDNEVRFLPKVVDGERNSEGQYILIREVLMKNKNGSPVINVPLNVRLDDQNNPNYDANAVQYVNSTIDRITRAIQSLIVERYTINGWDNSTTNLSVEPRINIDFGALRSTFGNAAPSTIADLFFNIYKDYVKNRDPEAGQYNGGPRNNLMKYYNNDGTLNTTEFTQTVPSSLIYANPRIVSQNNELSFGNVISTIFSSGNKFNNVMSGGEGQILFIDKEHQYLPNVNNTKAFGQMFFNDSIGENLIRRFEIKRNLRWMASYTPQFISNRTNANVIWLMKDSRNNDINGTAFNNYEYDNLAKLSINYNDRLANEDSNAISGLFGYIKDKNNRKAGEISFDNYNDWLDFVTVDLRKARYNSNTKTIDWNIDYVSSKVDIEEFKNNFESNVLVKLRNNDEEVYNAYLEFFKEANKDTTNQLWANEIMKRFSLTDYAMYTSNITIQDIKDNPDYAWIFDAKLGYGEFKKESFRIENHNPEEWQISTDGIISAYEKLAEKFESSLSSLNLYDTLIFDSKIQGYSDQTFINVSLRKFDLLSIFS